MKTMGGGDKCKTHAEWLEELRDEAAELRAKSYFNTADVLDGIAVNLQAAHNREFAEKIESLAATMPDIIQPVIERGIREALKVQEQTFELAGGDAAKLREALVRCRNCAQMISQFVQAPRPTRDFLDAAARYANLVIGEVDTALATPATAEKSSAVGDAAREGGAK